MNRFKLILAIVILSISQPSIAALEGDQAHGADIRILTGNHQTIEEYRSNGKTYMIKVKPKKGPAYYLIDADGDGNMDTRKNDLSPNLLIPSWVLFSW